MKTGKKRKRASSKVRLKVIDALEMHGAFAARSLVGIYALNDPGDKLSETGKKEARKILADWRGSDENFERVIASVVDDFVKRYHAAPASPGSFHDSPSAVRGRERAKPCIDEVRASSRFRPLDKQVLIHMLENCYEADAGAPDDETGACPQGLFCRESLYRICAATDSDDSIFAGVEVLEAISALCRNGILTLHFRHGVNDCKVDGEYVDGRVGFQIHEDAIAGGTVDGEQPEPDAV